MFLRHFHTAISSGSFKDCVVARPAASGSLGILLDRQSETLGVGAQQSDLTKPPGVLMVPKI